VPQALHGARLAWQLARHGLARFLEEFTANQFRYSLGLQMENGHWYAFPYPPAFYVLTWPLVRLARYRPEVAVSLLAAIVNSLEAWIVFGTARRLRAGTGASLAAAGALVLLPIFTARLTLAYFPALVGHAVDAAVRPLLEPGRQLVGRGVDVDVEQPGRCRQRPPERVDDVVVPALGEVRHGLQPHLLPGRASLGDRDDRRRDG